MLRIFRLGIVLMLAVAIGTAYWPRVVSAAAESTITGKVTNGTSGGGGVGGLQVTLTTYVKDAASGQQTTTTDADGKFQFNGLSTDATYSYGAKVTYKGVDYRSELVQLSADGTTNQVEIYVYETTTSDDAIKVTNGHVVIYPNGQGALDVLEIWGFNNSGDKTYVGIKNQDTSVTAQFTLPAGATSLSTGPGFAPANSGGKVLYSMPLIPGLTSLSLMYIIPYQSGDVVISRKTDHAVGKFGILIPEKGVEAKSVALKQSDSMNIQDTKYLYFVGSDLPAGKDMDLALKISPQAGTTSSAVASRTSSSTVPWPWLLVAVSGLGLIVTIAYPRLKRRPAAAGGRGHVTRDIDVEQEALLDQIASLDDQFEAGRIAEQEYRDKRARTKARLVQLRTAMKSENE